MDWASDEGLENQIYGRKAQKLLDPLDRSIPALKLLRDNIDKLKVVAVHSHVRAVDDGNDGERIWACAKGEAYLEVKDLIHDMIGENE